MFKKFVAVILAMLISLSFSALSEYDIHEDIQDMTIEELLELRIFVNQQLQLKGYTVYFDLSHGDKGEDVAALQKRLLDLGYYSGSISGKYDPQTQKSVKMFQKDNALDGNGVATIETQTLLFSDEISAKATPTPNPSLSPTPTISEEYSEYVPLNYTDAARYPEKYFGTKVVIKGTVVQVIGTKNSGFTLRVSVSGYSDILYITVSAGLVDFNILEDDRLTIYATMLGTKTYISTFSQSITIPSAKADFVILR